MQKRLCITFICCSIVSALNAGSDTCASFCSVPLEKQEPQVIPESAKKKKTAYEKEIPLTEDLMREHGVLNRVLLIYDEIIRRIDTNTPFSPATLEQAATIIKTFVEDYHEKMEEDYLFPLFEKHKVEVQLVRTLRLQHNRGRQITTRIQQLAQGQTELDQKKKKTIRNLLHQFIHMYRPHEAREDTVVFPKVRSLMPEQEFKAMGEKFEQLEHQLLGKHGYQNTVDKVAAIEKELNIYNLEEFTPPSVNTTAS